MCLTQVLLPPKSAFPLSVVSVFLGPQWSLTFISASFLEMEWRAGRGVSELLPEVGSVLILSSPCPLLVQAPASLGSSFFLTCDCFLLYFANFALLMYLIRVFAQHSIDTQLACASSSRSQENQAGSWVSRDLSFS